MIRVLFAFWPVLIPFAAYLLWWNTRGKRLRDDGLLDRAKHRRILGWTAALSALAGVATAALLLSTLERSDGVYVPPHMENGTLVEGRFEPVPAKDTGK